MEIIRGKIDRAKKVVVYGPEGIGKSTFASKFPDPVFIDTEGSTGSMDVARFQKPSSWQMLNDQIDYVIQHPDTCRTLIIDTVDWAEQMCIEDVCSKHQKKGIEDFGYGNGYVYVKEEMGKWLNKLSDVIDKGVHVVLTAHAQIRKFEQPDELGAYDRYELKLGKKTSSQTSPLIKEWADMLLFANYKTISVATDDKGKKHKAQGGRRVMYTAHHPCWDAKNRYDLPEELPFEYAAIAHVIADTAQNVKTPTEQPVMPPRRDPVPEEPIKSKEDHVPPSNTHNTVQEPLPLEGEQTSLPIDQKPISERLVGVPPALRDLMLANDVDEWDIQNVVAYRGYFPSDMPISDYPEDFVAGVLVGAWEQVFGMIKEMREKQEIPFEN